jgi:hypothetical protein
VAATCRNTLWEEREGNNNLHFMGGFLLTTLLKRAWDEHTAWYAHGSSRTWNPPQHDGRGGVTPSSEIIFSEIISYRVYDACATWDRHNRGLLHARLKECQHSSVITEFSNSGLVRSSVPVDPQYSEGAHIPSESCRKKQLTTPPPLFVVGSEWNEDDAKKRANRDEAPRWIRPRSDNRRLWATKKLSEVSWQQTVARNSFEASRSIFTSSKQKSSNRHYFGDS